MVVSPHAAPPDHQRLVSIAHLEHQLAACRVLGHPSEYRAWLHAYANALGLQLAVRQVRELCDELLGPIGFSMPPPPPGSGVGEEHEMATAAPALGGWSPTVCGLSKRALLKEVVLPALAQNRSLQRILAEYVEALAEV